MRIRSLTLLGFLLVGACDDEPFSGGDSSPVVSDASVFGETAPDLTPDGGPDTAPPGPTITAVTDAGKDGSALVGELVYLTGTNFDSTCKVSLGKVAARVLGYSQTEVRFQTPEAIPVGVNAGTLTCGHGSAVFSLTVLRYHLVTVPAMDRVAVMQETKPGDISDSKLRVKVSQGDGVVLSDDSAVAYVATARNILKAPRVTIVDLVAAGGPKALVDAVPYSQQAKLPIYGLATAARAPVLATATGLRVTFFDITDPRKPVEKGNVQFVSMLPGRGLPKILAGYFIDVAITPDGKIAVLLDAASDQIHVYNISNLASPKAVQTKIKVAAGTSAKLLVEIPVVTGLLGGLKVQGGSSQDIAISADGTQVAVLAGGGLGALFPETFNLDLSNSTLTVWDLSTNAYVTNMENLKQAHLPNNVAWAPSGDAHVTSLSSATALLTKVIFQIAVMVAINGGSVDLTGIASLLFKNYQDLLNVIKAAWQGKLFDLGGLHLIKNGKASKGTFTHVPYIQGGLCTTYDEARMLVAGQGWIVNIKFGLPKVVEKFVFKYDLGVTVHDLKTKKYKYQSLYPWKIKMLLPPWSFGQAACQQ